MRAVDHRFALSKPALLTGEIPRAYSAIAPFCAHGKRGSFFSTRRFKSEVQQVSIDGMAE
jgi:hypothetical protein